MSADEHFHHCLPILKMCSTIIFGVAWLVISILIYKNGTSQYSMVIEHETGEWAKGAILDFVA
jgi:hypothetical protein